MIWLIVSAMMLITIVGAAIRALTAHKRLSEVTPLDFKITNAPKISVIIPARNEAHNIEGCLRSIQTQTYPNFEVIVVDDNSDDCTGELVREIAQFDPRIHLVTGSALPPDWKGKPHACWQAAQVADGEWLCFIDADTQAYAPMLGSALMYAQNHQLVMMSLNPFQVVNTFWERVLIPAGLFFLALAFDANRLENPNDPAALANGQFILVQRAAYFASGGHKAVRTEILEDVLLARHMKASGFRVAIRAGTHLIQTRMYTTLAEMWEGLTKNSLDILEGRVDKVLGALLAALLLGIMPTLLPLLAFIVILSESPGRSVWVAFIVGLCAFTLITWQRYLSVRYFRIPMLYALTTPLAAMVASAILLNSIWRQRTGRGVTWKGRRYVATDS